MLKHILYIFGEKIEHETDVHNFNPNYPPIDF